MVKHFSFSLLALAILCLIPFLAVKAGADGLIGIVIPYLAFVLFIGGFIWRILSWSRSAVPFKIPTTCGQQKSLPWIKSNSIDNPFTKGGVIVRMLLEVLFFRSLFRNTVMSVKETDKGSKLVYNWEIFLWAGALAFHYTFLLVFLRHMRFFMEPVPRWIQILETLDGFFRIEYVGSAFAIGLPGVLISGILLFAATVYLLGRRIADSKVRYISLAADYFPLLLVLAIAYTGIHMRYLGKVDVVSVKELTMGFASFQPMIPEGIGAIFYIHFFLVCALFAYFPFSKLVHLGGVFLSPTRNLTADTRMNRHINPWNPEVKTHSYEAYEDEFRKVMAAADLPLEKKE